MGDGCSLRAGNNRLVRSLHRREELKLLEWKPRLAAVLVVLTLVVTAAIASGYLELIADNWEW